MEASSWQGEEVNPGARATAMHGGDLVNMGQVLSLSGLVPRGPGLTPLPTSLRNRFCGLGWQIDLGALRRGCSF